jgi:sugar lactone lactonase YvrE
MKRTVVNLLFVAILAFSFPIPYTHADTIYISSSKGIEEFDSSDGSGSIFAAGVGGDLAFNPNGTLYQAGNNAIYSIDSNGNASLFADSGLDGPEGIAFDSSGNLYVVNNGNNTIEEFGTNSVGTLFANTTDYPQGLAFDNSGNLYAASPGGENIDEFDTNGVETLFARDFGDPDALAFDSHGDLYVSDAFSGTISKFGTNGVGTLFAHVTPNFIPVGLAFDSSGNLYVACYSPFTNGLGFVEEFNAEGVGMDFVDSSSGWGIPTWIAIEEIPEPSALLLLAVAAITLSPFLNRHRRR